MVDIDAIARKTKPAEDCTYSQHSPSIYLSISLCLSLCLSVSRCTSVFPLHTAPDYSSENFTHLGVLCEHTDEKPTSVCARACVCGTVVQHSGSPGCAPRLAK